MGPSRFGDAGIRGRAVGIREVALLAIGLIGAFAIRVLLLPAVGFWPDLNAFAAWTHLIATEPLGHAFRTDLNFGPSIAYIYWLLGVVQPAFATATNAADPTIRVALKVPGVVADAGLVVAVAWLLRDRPRWAIRAALGVALAPAAVCLSAWWGQWESVYVLAGLIAAVLVLGGRPNLAAVVLAVALLTKPQALAFIPPLVAFAWVRFGARRALVSGVVLVATVVVLWLPFVADGGVTSFLGTIARLQSGLFGVLSLNAWNAWWLVQWGGGHGNFLADGTALVGPFTPRAMGYVSVAALELVVMWAVARAPTMRGLLLGLAASVLVCFVLLTAMHERYSYGAVVFLAPLIPDRRVLFTWVILNVVVLLNIAAAILQVPIANLQLDGIVGVIGSAVMVGVTFVVLWLLGRTADESVASPELGAPLPALTE